MKKITIEDITKIKSVGNVVISPDGKNAVFTVVEPNAAKNSYDYNLWLYSLESGETRQLTFLGKDGSAIWDNSDTLLIPTSRQPSDLPDKIHKKSAFYRLNIKGGEAYKAFELAENVSRVLKISDGLYAMTINRDRNWLDPETHDKEVCEEELDYHIIEEVPLWANGLGFVSGKRTGLYLYKEEDGQLTQLTDPYFDVRAVDIKDGKIAYSGCLRHDLVVKTAELNIYDTASGETTQVVAPGQVKIGPVAFEGDSLVYTASDMKKWGSGQLTDIYRYDLKTGKSVMAWKNTAEMAIGAPITSDVAMLGGKTFTARDGLV